MKWKRTLLPRIVLFSPIKGFIKAVSFFLRTDLDLPIIATDIGSFREDIIDGETGFICKPNNANDMAEKLKIFFDSSYVPSARTDPRAHNRARRTKIFLVEYWQANVRSLCKNIETLMKRLSKNILSLFSADIARRLFGFISVAYLARVLGKEGFGAVNLGFAVLAYIMVLSAAGFPTLGTKRIAQGALPELAGSVIGSRLIVTSIVLLVAAAAVLTTVQNTTLARLIILFSCAVLPQIFFVDWFFQGKETLGIVSAARVLQAIVYLGVVLIFVRTINDIMWVAAGSIAGECAASVLLFIRFRISNKGVRYSHQTLASSFETINAIGSGCRSYHLSY